MKRRTAYSVFSNFSDEASRIIRNAGIDLTINSSSSPAKGEELATLLEEYDILIIGVSSRLEADMIERVKTPKIIATLSVGLDHVDKVFFESPLVTIVNLRMANVISVAEHIFGLILALNKRIVESNRLVLEGRGHKKNLHERPEDISGKTLGLVGCGNITQEVIKIAKVFGMNMICYTKHPERHEDLARGGVRFAALDEVMRESDIVNVSVPLNDETKGMISREKIGMMKPIATFINTSRVDVVDTGALMEHADLYDTFYVGLDIDTDEYKELLSKYRDNVIVTPHTAGVSKQAISRMDLELAEKVAELV